jgi:hypothetical protein
MSKKNRIISLCCLFVFALSACMTTADKIKANKGKGEEIIRALTKYEQTHGQFPKSLNALSPDFLSEIPKTVEGGDFIYGIGLSAEPYYLIFKISDGSGCNYLPAVNLWECTKGGITIEN